MTRLFLSFIRSQFIWKIVHERVRESFTWEPTSTGNQSGYKPFNLENWSSVNRPVNFFLIRTSRIFYELN